MTRSWFGAPRSEKALLRNIEDARIDVARSNLMILGAALSALALVGLCFLTASCDPNTGGQVAGIFGAIVALVATGLLGWAAFHFGTEGRDDLRQAERDYEDHLDAHFGGDK